MKKVYVLLYDNGYDGYDYHGVYSSKENAEKKIAQFVHGSGDYFDIREDEIDEEL